MATVRPFKGIRYNKSEIDDLSKVVAPPYDVISESQQAELCDRHPRNVVRLILGEPGENDGDSQSFYNASAERFKAWREEGTLAPDVLPSIYLTAVDFAVRGRTYTRYGIMAYVGLEPFENKVVLPHERTSSKVKTDRLNLIKTTRANYCQIFSLYNDPSNEVLNMVREAVQDTSPENDLVDDAGERHRLWVINDSAVIEKVAAAMREKRLYIADGHHRYETALNYKKWVAENDPDYDENHPANFIMMYLTSTTDPGLIILPTHRLLPDVSREVLTGLVDRAGKFFDIKQIPFESGNRKEAQAEFMSELRAGSSENTIGLAINGQSAFYLLTPRADAIEEVLGDAVPPTLRRLDVTILTQMILIRILGYTQAQLDEEKVIDYSSDDEEAVEAVLSGEYSVSFLLNATRNDQMQSVAAEGEIMPRKTTFYYPKVLTGLVMSSKEPDRT
ncbi:MAG: DUF1015 domain-containing protein [Desulfosudaceae bacterium]